MIQTKQKVTKFFDQPRTRAAKSVQGLILALIIYSVAVVVIEIVKPEMVVQYQEFLGLAEIVVIVVFSAEYLIRLWAAKSRGRFVVSFYNVIDLLAIVPFFLSPFNLSFLRALRIGRIVRALRGARVLKTMKYTTADEEGGNVGMPRILKENIAKNIIVLGALFVVADPLHRFLVEIDPSFIGDVIFATSIVALAAMFGFFALSYGDANPEAAFDRFMIHTTSGMLLFPIGVMFLVLQESLGILLQQDLLFFLSTMWFVYAAVVMWDFWNVHRMGKDLS